MGYLDLNRIWGGFRLEVLRAWVVLYCGGVVIADDSAPKTEPEAPLPAKSVPDESSTQGRLFVGRAGYLFAGYLPAAYVEKQGKHPLLLFLHGACADEKLDKFEHVGPLPYAKKHPEFPFVVVCPATSGAWSVPKLTALLAEVQLNYGIDPGHVYVTGHSNGGNATWMLACAYPERFAAIAPISGSWYPGEAARKLRRLPVWIFHGEFDDVIPASHGLNMKKALEKVGGNVQMTLYPREGHGLANKPFTSSEFYEWLLKQERKLRLPAADPPDSVTQ